MTRPIQGSNGDGIYERRLSQVDDNRAIMVRNNPADHVYQGRKGNSIALAPKRDDGGIWLDANGHDQAGAGASERCVCGNGHGCTSMVRKRETLLRYQGSGATLPEGTVIGGKTQHGSGSARVKQKRTTPSNVMLMSIGEGQFDILGSPRSTAGTTISSSLPQPPDSPSGWDRGDTGPPVRIAQVDYERAT